MKEKRKGEKEGGEGKKRKQSSDTQRAEGREIAETILNNDRTA